MQLTIVTPEGVICRAEVESVKLSGTKAPFTVLKGHAPLMSTLERGDVVYVSQGEEYRVPIRSGVVNVFNDTIEVCAEQDAPTEKSTK